MTIDKIEERVPSLRSTPIIGAARELREDYLGTVLRAAREVGDIARVYAGPPGWRVMFYSVATPDLVSEILSQPDRYTKQNQFYREVRSALGNGMLTSEHEVWQRQRRFLAPMFTPKRISTDYSAIMVEEAQAMVRRWSPMAAGGAAVDVRAEMVELTARIIGRILFGADMTSALPKLTEFRYVSDLVLQRGFAPHPAPTWLPTRANRRLAAGLAGLRDIVDAIIAQRRGRPGSPPAPDLLGLLLHARDAENSQDRLSDEEVADQVLIFLLAGHDTTASTLACLLVELARAPEWQQTLRDELDQGLGGQAVGADDVDDLPWTLRAVREAMRLYPAAHSIGRSTTTDEVLQGYRIPAGSAVVVSPWAVHRSPKVWPDPDRFDPRRFDVPAGQFPGGHKYAWFPFGAGPRACIGLQLAMLETPIVLATILQNYRLSTSVHTIPLDAAITLRPAEPLPVHVQPASPHRVSGASRP
ncbi:MAG TPA: cytochrome P450 [Propionibacteriaceae bacterium]|nr:cytochrome P450 [Propionibacteriaceae bacterium]